MARKTIRLADSDGNIIYPESGQSSNGYLQLADGTMIKWGLEKIVEGSYAAISAHGTPFVGHHYLIATTDYARFSRLDIVCMAQPQEGSSQDNVYVRYGDGTPLSASDIALGYVNYIQIGRWK